MGRYIEWDDVVDRYPEINTLGGADEVGSAYIAYAETFVDGILSSHFTPPFSNNNMTVRDLTIDCVFWRAARFKYDNAIDVKSDFFASVSMLKSNQMDMIAEDGTIIGGTTVSPGVFSTTQSYHTSFGIDDPTEWMVSSDHMSDVQDSRL